MDHLIWSMYAEKAAKDEEMKDEKGKTPCASVTETDEIFIDTTGPIE